MTLNFYEEADDGINAQNELIDVRSVDRVGMDEVLDRALTIITTGSGPIYDARRWGTLYLVEEGDCFAFLRHAPAAPAQWLFVMFGLWMRDASAQAAEAVRRSDMSERL